MPEYTREDHRAMILDPFKWPHLVLPIKRYKDGQMDTALVFAGMERLKPSDPIQVKLNTTIFGPLPGESKMTVYANVDALLDDGWVVD